MSTGTERPLRILQVSARFRPYVGGTEIHTGEVSAELVRRGHKVTVLSTDLGGDLPAEEDNDGVLVKRVRAWPRRSDLYFAPGLRRVICDGDWDLVHVQGYHTAVAPVALWVAQRRGIPTALTFHSGGHSSRLRNLARPIHTRAIARLLKHCDLLVGVSDFEADLFTQRLGLEPGRILTIPNGISSSRKAKCEDQSVTRDPAGDGPHLLSIGRLQRYKGHHRVIRAMPKLLAADPRTRVTIIGTGPYQSRLERLVRKLDLEASVTFDSVGSDDRDRLDEMMASATAAVFLSEYESHGMAAHEALLAGLPVVVLDATALGRLADDGLASAVPPLATDDEVAAIVLRTLAASGRPGSAPPLSRLESLRHSWHSITARLEQAYLDVIPTSVGDRALERDRVG